MPQHCSDVVDTEIDSSGSRTTHPRSICFTDHPEVQLHPLDYPDPQRPRSRIPQMVDLCMAVDTELLQALSGHCLAINCHGHRPELSGSCINLLWLYTI